MKLELQDQKQVDEAKATLDMKVESVEPNYMASYTATKHNHHHEKHNQHYQASYTTSDAHKANQPHYSSNYKTNTYDSNEAHTVYGTSHAHEANHPYITQYGAKKVSKESPNDDTTVPYITSYGRNTPAQQVNHPKITQYGAKKVSKESPNDDTTVTYITSYGGNTPAQQVNHPYITQYGAKKVSKESPNDDTTVPYITQYGGANPKNNPKKSSNVDHTEAFKVGFFALDDLHVGNVMTLQFPIQEVSHFLPKREADSIPFSTSQLPSVLQLFSIPEDSPEASAMRDTLEQCEGETITGETKICATSLESMLEFVGSTVGSETKRNLLTTSLPTSSGVPLQKFTILEVSEDINAPKWVACHPLPYPYAIYYCHFIGTGSKVFKVSLGSENGDNKVEALGICHLDTSDWNPDHVLFRQLGIKAGQDPVCHFFPVKHLLWVPQPSQATM